MGELKQIYLLIHSDIAKNNVKEAFVTLKTHYNNIKDIKGFQKFIVSVISTLAQNLKSQLPPRNQNEQSSKNVNHVIKFADYCFELLVLSELQLLKNSLYMVIRYLLLHNHVTEAVHFSNYFLKYSSSPCDILKDLVQLFAYYIHKLCPIDDELKKLNVVLMWDAALNIVKHYTGKEIEYALYSLTTLVKNINGLILDKGRSIDLVILDMTLESVLSSIVFRKQSDQENMLNLHSMLIENIVAVMQNMMRRKQMHVHFLVKHIELMIDVCSLNKTEKEALSFLILLFKFIDNSIKNGLDSNFELRKMITFVQKHKHTEILPNTLLYHVLKATIITITKLKNLWFEGLIINSSETVSQMFVLLQHLVYMSEHGSSSMICCKSNNCDLKEDSTSEMSLINIAFIMMRHIVSINVKFLNLKDVSKWMELFTSLFERVSKSSCSNKISFIEFSLTCAYNLCIHVTSGELVNLCLNFLQNVYSTFDSSGINSDLVARLAIILSRYLYNTKQNDEALKCIAYWCVRTRSELAAQQWVNFKCSEEKNNYVVKQTILKMFEKNTDLKIKWPDYSSLKKSDHIEIMWLELKAHADYHQKIKQDTTTILELFEELMRYNKLSKDLKSQVIIATAYIILHSNSMHGLQSVIDVIEDYINKLQIEISLKKKNVPLMLGNLYYANFLCLLKYLQFIVCKELNTYTEEKLQRGMEAQNILQYKPMSWIFPLQKKKKLFNCLYNTVKNWSALTNDAIGNEQDIKKLFRSLHEVAFVFKLYCDPKEVEVWQLLYQLASYKKCDKYVFIALSELMKIGIVDNLELDNLAKNVPMMAIEYKLASVTYLLNQSKYSEAQTLLESIEKSKLNSNVLLMAECSFLKSRLCFESRQFNDKQCLCIFIEAYNLAHGLIKRLDSFYEYLAMHFVLLSICSYLNLIFINTLKPFEARCFLKVQMNIVLKSVLTKRALNVFLMSSWNELTCCNFENTQGELEHVMTLLDFEEDEFETKVQQITTSRSTNILSSPLSDYRCVQNPRINHMASPNLKHLNQETARMSITEYCNDVIKSNTVVDPVIFYSVIELCIIKAVYYSKANQPKMANNYFKLMFKLLTLSEPQFNKNEIYNILRARQNSLAKYHYANHLVLFNNSSKSLNYINKCKELCQDGWLSIYVNELSLSLKIDDILCKYPCSNVVHSPVVEPRRYECKTPASKNLANNKPKTHTRFLTPAVRKLKMSLESPKSRENTINSPLNKETEKKKKERTTKEESGKENIKFSTKPDMEIKLREKRSTRRKEPADQTSTLIIKKRSNRLNI